MIILQKTLHLSGIPRMNPNWSDNRDRLSEDGIVTTRSKCTS